MANELMDGLQPFLNNAQAPPQQQIAQSSPIQIQPIGNGMVRVIDIRTGQTLYTGSASGAANAQASQMARVRRGQD